MLKKLRIKFVVTNMIIVTLMLSAIFGLMYHFTAQNMERVSQDMMRSIADRPFQIGGPGEKTSNVRLPYALLQISKNGEIVATGGGYFDLSDSVYLDTLIAEVKADGEDFGVLKEYDLRYYYSEKHGEQIIILADTSSETATLRDMRQTFYLIGAASFLMFLGISLLLAHWEVKPVEEAWKQQRQFIADASHELKTPLTVILTNAELLQSSDYDEESRSHFSASILSMAQQMRGLVEQLLELARADSSQTGIVFAPLDLSSLVRDASLPFEPLLYEKGLTMDSELEPNISVNGGGAQLRQVMEVLLDNARKYSSPGGNVIVSLRRQGHSRCLLTVANTGPAIADDDLKNIFKRFYRADKARSSGGFGLGLSIAYSIISAHKGRIWAESKNGQNSFMIELPTQDEKGLPQQALMN